MSVEGGRAADRAGQTTEDAIEAAGEGDRESIAEVLASIRALVSEESRARQAPAGQELATVLMLTPAMVVADTPAQSGEILAEGIDTLRPARAHQPAPILDEEALRGVINSLVREELQGELGDRISRNLRKLIRRELAQMLEEQKRDDG